MWSTVIFSLLMMFLLYSRSCSTAVIFYHFQDCSKSLTTEGTDTSADMHLENDVSLGSQDNHEALFDITRSPLTDFHRHERSHLEKTIQVNFCHSMIYQSRNTQVWMSHHFKCFSAKRWFLVNSSLFWGLFWNLLSLICLIIHSTMLMCSLVSS